MCRLIALPPGTTKKEALEVVKDFYIGNDDGTGSVYAKDGQFVVNKWPLSFKEVIKKRLPLVDHMPYEGWTLIHVRAASHGKNNYENTHPIVRGKWAVCHNGIFHEHAPVRAALNLVTEFKGQTDTEVAAALWQLAGPKVFMKTVSTSGVFLFLKNNGQLHVVCTSGDLLFKARENSFTFASEFPLDYKKTTRVDEGYFKMSKKGKVLKSFFEKSKTYSYSSAKRSIQSYSKSFKSYYSKNWDSEDECSDDSWYYEDGFLKRKGTHK